MVKKQAKFLKKTMLYKCKQERMMRESISPKIKIKIGLKIQGKFLIHRTKIKINDSSFGINNNRAKINL